MRRSPIASVAALLFATAASLLLSGDTRSRRAAGAPAQDMQTQNTALGETIRLHLQSAPFPHPDRQNGFTYEQVLYPADPHYVDSSVAVFVPRGFRPAGPINLVFFFHGWDTTIDDAQQQFDLYRQFSLSGAQALLVLPELAWNAPDSFGGKLEEKGGFTRLVNELLGVLSTNHVISGATAGNIVLAGHSGAFQVIAKILINGDLASHIKEVCLFDALYARTSQYAAWIENRGGRFVSVSAADGEQTTDVDALIGALQADGVPLVVASDDPENDSQALSARVVFLRSDSDHYGVIGDQQEFRRLMDASPDLTP